MKALRPGTLAMLIVIFAIATLLFSCAKKIYQLPSSWPIQTLTLPQGSVLDEKPMAVHQMTGRLEDKEWVVSFNYIGSNPDDVKTHIEACLKPLNYQQLWFRNGRDGEDSQVDESYFSPDGCMKVYLLDRRDLPASVKYPDDSDFVLFVEQTESPNHRHAQATNRSQASNFFLRDIQ